MRKAGGLGRSRGRRGRMVRAKISISDFHILNTLIYLTLGLFQTREKGEEGMGGGRGKGARVLMTFSLWNLVSIVSVVNILPEDSTCHHGHTGSELLNGHRWYYTLCANADDLIPVRLWCFFFCNMPMSADDLLLTSASLCSTFQDVICATFMPTSPSLSISALSASSSARQLKFTTPQSSRWDECLSEEE